MALLSSLCIPSTTHLSTHNHSFSSFSNIHNHSITTINPFSSFQSLQLSLPYHTPTLLTTKQNPNFTLRFSQQAQAEAEAAPSVSTDEHAEQEVSQTRLLAQNVPWTSTPEDIRSLFERYGKVLQVELSMYNKTKNRGLAFVEMSSPEEARAALQNLESYEFDGRILKLNYAHIKKKKTPPPVKPKPVTFNLFVANLHYEARSKDLKEFFDDGSGSVVSAAVIFHDNPRRSSGYGFVAFKSKKQADSALNEFQGKVTLKIFMGRPIRVARGRQFVKERAKEGETSEDTASELNGEEADKAD
ncbi:28 kDa ribonucleoprotein, chloroplastic isoform X1 [Arachis duranensis]|uniref:28 kDa ribonucleoprotein, chloroplastic isoform X1 n=1 Tax=Arachis duranensis TaxID=130453 RepID=A0A9C6WNI9_ARADU|nr:28 kDa ribonucleoprotein, chloroplastic isoform X1 [Arachis duranensis]XP_052108362.1 28 kDa ribonucleoprotein, chloroplastic isoform X1 [Arachis duranensis]XP_052108363.1 28 kDa ribonucleoprotein, chloroplastic isoform X1 [Arachis duranensis]